MSRRLQYGTFIVRLYMRIVVVYGVHGISTIIVIGQLYQTDISYYHSWSADL